MAKCTIYLPSGLLPSVAITQPPHAITLPEHFMKCPSGPSLGLTRSPSSPLVVTGQIPSTLTPFSSPLSDTLGGLCTYMIVPSPLPLPLPMTRDIFRWELLTIVPHSLLIRAPRLFILCESLTICGIKLLRLTRVVLFCNLVRVVRRYDGDTGGVASGGAECEFEGIIMMGHKRH